MIEIDEEATTPESFKNMWWLKEMNVSKSDEQALLSAKELPENIYIASQMLLKKQYPHIESLQDTFKGKFLSFQPVREKKMSVQILHTGM